MPHSMAWRVVLSIFLFSSFCVLGSFSQLHIAEPRGPTFQSKFGVEVKGPASQLLHKQALEYMGHLPGNSEIEDSAQFEDLSKPPSKGTAQHASVLSVAVYTLLMASATVKSFMLRFVIAGKIASLMLSATGFGSASILFRARAGSAVITPRTQPGERLV